MEKRQFLKVSKNSKPFTKCTYCPTRSRSEPVNLGKSYGEKLVQLMIEYNVGVTTRQTYEVKRLDLDYFSEDE